MDEQLRRLEERLEGLVPKGISDHGRTRLEETVEELAARDATRKPGGNAWKWGAGIAAAMGIMTGVQFVREPSAPPVAISSMHPGVVEAVFGDEVSYPGFGDDISFPVVETVALTRQVEGRFDEGWVEAEGAPHVYRCWEYEVTDEEAIIDEETGYEVTVYSERQERIPVRITSL